MLHAVGDFEVSSVSALNPIGMGLYDGPGRTTPFRWGGRGSPKDIEDTISAH